jgi:hypothetical protein
MRLSLWASDLAEGVLNLRGDFHRQKPNRRLVEAVVQIDGNRFWRIGHRQHPDVVGNLDTSHCIADQDPLRALNKFVRPRCIGDNAFQLNPKECSSTIVRSFGIGRRGL